ncbi:hypothetical protein ABW21_db0201456 [Orbilia brochopaga]|nr:hypothetical protein ABW21_db0201456 [Drechslerella brochopaga]
MPRVVLLAHLHALLPSRTETERSIAALAADGVLRRVQVRGTAISSSMEGVMLTDDFLIAVARSSLDGEVKEPFLELLARDPSLATLESTMLPRDSIMALLSAGFLTINSSTGTHNDVGVDITALTPTTVAAGPLPPRDHTHISTLSSLSSISQSRSSLSSSSSQSRSANNTSISYTITPPNLGLLTHLHASSKSHILDILRRCPNKEATISYLRERWDGGVSKNKHREDKRKRNGEGGGKFEGRTRKWREYRGVSVDWVVAGLVGSGVLEGFYAVGVGRGYRVV